MVLAAALVSVVSNVEHWGIDVGIESAANLVRGECISKAVVVIAHTGNTQIWIL